MVWEVCLEIFFGLFTPEKPVAMMDTAPMITMLEQELPTVDVSFSSHERQWDWQDDVSHPGTLRIGES